MYLWEWLGFEPSPGKVTMQANESAGQAPPLTVREKDAHATLGRVCTQLSSEMVCKLRAETADLQAKNSVYPQGERMPVDGGIRRQMPGMCVPFVVSHDPP